MVQSCCIKLLRVLTVLKKRIIGTITVLNGWAVQSISYSKYLPLGRPEVIAENLDRWGADEILIQCIDRSRRKLGPDFKTLSSISDMGITTPIIYSGGIRNHVDAINSIKLGADRIMFDELLRSHPDEISKSSRILGSQALVGCMPISCIRGKMSWFNYLTKETIPLTSDYLKKVFSSSISELLLVDHKNEGCAQSFNLNILKSSLLADSPIPILLFGGISNPQLAQKALNNTNVAGIGIGNFLSYRENSIEFFKRTIKNSSLREHKFKALKKND